MKKWIQSLVRYGLLILLLANSLSSHEAMAEVKISDLCRIKGHREIHLQGIGLVVGLKETSDTNTDGEVSAQTLAQMLKVTGVPLPSDTNIDSLKESVGVGLVLVTATIPAGGACAGDKLDCMVRAISGKSLQGGYLMSTKLSGTQLGTKEIYAVGQGAIQIDDENVPAVAKIPHGGQVETECKADFRSAKTIQLVLKKEHAGLFNVQEIEDLLNGEPDFNEGRQPEFPVARALDQREIEVEIPNRYQSAPVLFASLVMNSRIYTSKSPSRVVIRRQTGVIIVGQDVFVRPVVIKHKEFTIDLAARRQGESVSSAGEVDRYPVALKSLVKDLTDLEVETSDVIDIIIGLERSGDLYGELIVD